MIIRFSDKFESILYAIMYSNLTGYFLIAKSQADNLFIHEEYCDIDLISCSEILNSHNEKFGPIQWLDPENNDFIRLKGDIDLALHSWKQIKYKNIVSSIKIAFKMGLKYLYGSQPLEFVNVLSCVNNVK